MNILVLGASQGTGALAVQAALERGHDVTAFARSPDKLAIQNPRLKRVVGDFHKADSVAAAVLGHQAVIITASAKKMSTFKENPTYFSQGTGYTIDAMKKAGVPRLVVLSALGAGESIALANWFLRTIAINWLLKAPFADHDVQEKQVMASGLEWVIARPTRLTNGSARKQYVKKATVEPVPGSISRADVADFLVTACETLEWVGKAVQLGG